MTTIKYFKASVRNKMLVFQGIAEENLTRELCLSPNLSVPEHVTKVHPHSLNPNPIKGEGEPKFLLPSPVLGEGLG
jgi:hypothetical protein